MTIILFVFKQIDKREYIPDIVVLFTYEYDGKDDDVYQYNKCMLLFKIIFANPTKFDYKILPA